MGVTVCRSYGVWELQCEGDVGCGGCGVGRLQCRGVAEWAVFGRGSCSVGAL